MTATSAQSTPKLRIRVFKIVLLGDGGVGKSGKSINEVLRVISHLKSYLQITNGKLPAILLKGQSIKSSYNQLSHLLCYRTSNLINFTDFQFVEIIDPQWLP